MKRMMQRQGQLGADGAPAPVKDRRPPATRTAAPAQKARTSPTTFLKEVRGELRKVAWPSRAEVINYSIIVLICLVVVTTLIFCLDYVFAKSALKLFNV